MTKVDKNIPIPAIDTKKSKYDFPFAYMDINDSFLIEESKDNEVASIRGSLHYALTKFNKQNNSNIKVITRTTPEGLRVWRVS